MVYFPVVDVMLLRCAVKIPQHRNNLTLFTESVVLKLAFEVVSKSVECLQYMNTLIEFMKGTRLNA